MIDGRHNPLVAKLSQFAPLSDKDVGLLEMLCLPEERFGAGANIVVEGETLRSGFVLTRGMACRYRLMPDGRRQILTILIPGDFFDLHGFLLQAMDHSVATIGPKRIAAIGREAVMGIIANHPRIGAALWWSAMQEEAILRERIVALGRRTARGRVAYLLRELFFRLRAIGMAEDHAIRLPFTQADLADALGLTSVHTNRVLQGFRREELIALQHRRLTLLDFEGLQAIAGLTQDYLKFDSTPAPSTGRKSRHGEQIDRGGAAAFQPSLSLIARSRPGRDAQHISRNWVWHRPTPQRCSAIRAYPPRHRVSTIGCPLE